MKKRMLAMVALSAMLIAGKDSIAGEVGKVTLNKDVYRVGETNATVEVTDGTGGYKAEAGSGFGQVSANFSKAGTHPITISDSPSKSINDSGVTVRYPAPQSGEEEKSVTAFCTVAQILIPRDLDSYTFWGLVINNNRTGQRMAALAVSIAGQALPPSVARVLITLNSPKTTGLVWHPDKYSFTVASEDFSVNRVFVVNPDWDDDSFMSGAITATASYLGITQNSTLLYSRYNFREINIP